MKIIKKNIDNENCKDNLINDIKFKEDYIYKDNNE